MPPLFMVFDVESVGLHGEGFAVGYVVIDHTGMERESGFFRAPPELATGRAAGLDWVRENVAPTLDAGLCQTFSDGMGSPFPKLVRTRFWAAWERWKGEGAILAADCHWPVEARFLLDCVQDEPITREWRGPYPFVDIASVRLAASLDPLGTDDRLDRELPVHNPLADARQSARLLIEALSRINSISDKQGS